MQPNDAGLNLIKTLEGLKLAAYLDVAGIWTIGYGHIADVVDGMFITADQAEEFLKGDLTATENYVTRAVGNARTTLNQFSAMVCLAYNIGVPIFGGFAPLAAQALIELTGSKLAPSYYLMATALVSLAALVALRRRLGV